MKVQSGFSLENYEEADDLQILNCLDNLKNIEGELIVVTDASYKKDLGPFHVDAASIREFVREHYKNFGEHFLETDVIIINMEIKVVWIFHHEGVYALVYF